MNRHHQKKCDEISKVHKERIQRRRAKRASLTGDANQKPVTRMRGARPRYGGSVHVSF